MLFSNYRKIITCLLCVLISNIAFSQSFEWVKIHTSEGLVSNFSSIVTDLNGNVYVAGNFMGTITVGPYVLEALGNNNQDAYIVKYDTHGNILWVRHITSPSREAIHALALSPDGHILATGYFQNELSIDGITLTKMKDDFGDTYLLKFHSNGTAVMGKNIGYSQVNLVDIGFGVTTDKAGNIYVAGGRGTSMYFSKLTNTGELIWRRTAGGTHRAGTQNAGPIAVDEDGFVYVAGLDYFTGQGNLFKLSPSGTFVWTQNFLASIGNILIDTDKNLVVSATILAPTTMASENIPFSSGLIGKMNGDGRWLWNSYRAGFGPSDLALNPANGDILFSGIITQTVSFDAIDVTLEEDSDVLIGGLSKNGSYKWVSKAGEENRDYGDVMNVDQHGNIFIAGEIRKDSVGVFQCLEKTGVSKKDMYVAKIAPFLNVPIFGPLELCEGEEASYSFTPISDYISYEWFNDNPELEVTPIDPTTISVKAKGKKSSTIGVRTTVDLGCEVIQVNHTIPITIHSLLTKGVISGPSEICGGRSNVEYLLSPAPLDASYTWVTQNDVTIQSSSDTKLFLNFPAGFTSTEIGLTMTGACNTIELDPFLITAKPKPGPIGPITTDEVLCASQKSAFHIEPVPYASSYMWFVDIMGGPRYNRSGNTSFDVDLMSGASGVSIFVQASNECGLIESPKLSFDVIRKPSETKPIVGPAELCEGREALYVVPVTTNAETFHWVFKTEKNITTLDESHASNQMYLTFTQPGTLTVRSVNACGEGPVASLPVAKIVDPDIQPVIERHCNSLSHTIPDATLSWFKEGELLGTATSIEITNGGVYELRYIGQCIERSRFITIDDDDFDIFIPNIFTPNGDDKNEMFQVSKFLQGSKITIYNRWGEPVYSSDNYTNGWDGGGLSSGVYYYAINSECSNAVYKGTLSIIR